MSAPRALLAEIVDYAGLFPPTGADMPTAVANHVAYASSADAWMLGRFVVPASRLGELRTALQSAKTRQESLGGTMPAVRVAVVLSADAVADIGVVRRFNDESARETIRARVDVLEGKLTDSRAIQAAASAARGDTERSALELFVEVASNADPRMLMSACRDAGVAAKLRMGGVTPDAFPPAPHVLRFVRCCLDLDVAFKATAGLHHPLCADYRLTYDDGAACTGMYGFLNVFLTAAAMAAGMDDAQSAKLLTERQAAAFTWSPDAVAWHDVSLTALDLSRARADIIRSFGSCSFREPVDDSRALGLIA